MNPERTSILGLSPESLDSLPEKCQQCLAVLACRMPDIDVTKASHYPFVSNSHNQIARLVGFRLGDCNGEDDCRLRPTGSR